MPIRLSPLTVALALTCAFAPVSARADSAEPAAENVKAALGHFTKARALYQAGNYKEAVSELEFAESLDPSAKDLVYNLGVVSEKLGNIPDALKHFKRYVQMDLDTAERTRAESVLLRLEGARRLMPAIPETDETAAPKKAAFVPPPLQPPANPKFTPVLITGAAIGAAGIALGTALGVKALSDRPASGAVTSASYPYSTFANAQIEAHNLAVAADVALGIGIAAATATLLLWVATRPRAPIYLSRTDTLPKLGAMTTANGGGISLFGSF